MNHKLLILCAVLAVPLLAETPARKITVSIEKKATAREQIEYARKLMRTVPATRGEERHLAVANAAGNLTAVERAWPDDHAAIAEANVLLVELYTNASMPQNAIEAAERGLTKRPTDHRLYAAAGRAYERVGNKAAANASYEKLVETFDARRGDWTENVGALSAAAFFFEKDRQHTRAAVALRRAAAVQGLTPTIRVTLLLRALEQSALTTDRGAVTADLAHLRDAHRRALATTLTPAQSEMLKIAEAAIERYERGSR
ncbi:MAG TPA: hypothetical protein VGF69_20830 [Thermoanaerobaculia bacterium]|jgi:tetratricopeptide (TPR) repeat protein